MTLSAVLPRDGARLVAHQVDNAMTKPIASLALMMLAEEGRVMLWHPVGRYLPEFQDAKVRIIATFRYGTSLRSS